MRETHEDGMYAVVLAGDQEVLRELRGRLEAACIPHRVVVEPDPPYLGEVMAIGIAPTSKEVLRPFVGSLPLLR